MGWMVAQTLAILVKGWGHDVRSSGVFFVFIVSDFYILGRAFGNLHCEFHE